MRKKPASYRLLTETREKLKSVAKIEERSQTAILEKALREYFARNHPDYPPALPKNGKSTE